MKAEIECTYCGFKWVETFYSQNSLQGMLCKKAGCNDKNLVVRDLNNKIDYYKGSPPFPSEIETWDKFRG